jgi:hypothetical protein
VRRITPKFHRKAGSRRSLYIGVKPTPPLQAWIEQHYPKLKGVNHVIVTHASECTGKPCTCQPKYRLDGDTPELN